MIPSARRPLVLALCAGALAAAGCDDPSCIFGPGNCRGGSTAGGLGSEPAVVPSDGARIVDGPPEVDAVFPSGSGAHTQSVIAVRFSESLAPASLAGGLEVVSATFGVPIALGPPLLTGDGRLVILVPSSPLQAGGSYLVRVALDAKLADLTGQTLVSSSSGELGTFAVASEPTDDPRVVTSFPVSGASAQSDLASITVVFDREMDPDTIDDDSWVVLVDGEDASPDPRPAPLAANGTELLQVWTWSPTDASGPASHGVGAEVELELSPSGAPIEDMEGSALPTTSVDFEVAAVGAPIEVRKHPDAEPSDAIGAPDLEPGEIALEVELASATEAGDRLGIFLFGTGLGEDPVRRAVLRRIDLDAGLNTVEVAGEDLRLVQEGDGVFADGELHVAVRHERGNVHSTVRLLDLDPEADGPQGLLFDVTRPRLLGLSTSGSDLSSFTSDQRGMVIVGRADEPIRRAEVTTSLGDNGPDPDVASSSPDGVFVARPVDVPDILDGASLPLAFDLTIYDRALNPAESTTSATFVQIGAVGPGAALPGPRVLVDVFDAADLRPIEGALVMTQQDAGGTVSDRASTFTDETGHAEPVSAASGETIVIVEAAGYDLFTFHGVPRQILQVPLARTQLASGATEGSAVAAVGVNIGTNRNQIADSRLPVEGPRSFAPDSCGTAFDGTTVCDFGPVPVRPHRLGAQSFLALSPPANLRAFALRIPAASVAAGATDENVVLSVPALLATLSAEEQAIGLPNAVDLDLSGAGALGDLDGAPLVLIEGISPGIPGPAAVGTGTATDLGGDLFAIEASYAGAADGIMNTPSDELGRLVTEGTLEADLFLRAEAADQIGQRVGARPRFSRNPVSLVPPDVPRLLSPAPGGSSGAPPYDLAVANVIVDSMGQTGLYHVVLRDPAGRRWHLWRPDPGDSAGGVRVHVSDVSSFGGVGLANGAISARVSVYAWPDLAAGFVNGFLWSDLEREAELFGHSGGVSFNQP